MRIPHPIPYQGSKRNLATDILRCFPERVATLIEPFAGSAAITLAAAARGLAARYVINDLNTPLVDLWKTIVESPEKLAGQYEGLWRTQHEGRREYYDKVREDFNRTGRPDYLLYLLARCVKASVRYNANGEFNQSPDTVAWVLCRPRCENTSLALPAYCAARPNVRRWITGKRLRGRRRMT